MIIFPRLAALAVVISSPWLAASLSAQITSEKPYSVHQTVQYPGNGGIDYVFADADARKLYVPRGGEVLVFDLDSLKPAGTIANARARGVAVDPKSHHGFSSSSPVVMWDSRTLATVKTIDVQGRPDGILFEPASESVFVFSHTAPNVTVINAEDGSVAGTIDLGGAPEQAASDGKGRLFVDLEDKDAVAVVDVKARHVVGRYELDKKGGTPAGLALDAENRRLFVFCRNPQTCVVLDADNGKIVATLPIGKGSDGGGFNPRTMEAFSSQADGTLTIIKENSPSDFVVAQTVETKARAKTCTLDAKTGRILLITTEPMPSGESSTPVDAKSARASGQQANPKKGGGGPAFLDILVVAR